MTFTKNVLDLWVQLWNNYNLDMVEKLFLNDERVSYFSSEKRGLIKGIENLIKHHKEFGFVEGGKETGNKLWLEDVSIEEYNKVVVVTADWIFQRKNSDSNQIGPVTLVYVEQDGYKIAHAHFSNY